MEEYAFETYQSFHQYFERLALPDESESQDLSDHKRMQAEDIIN